MQKSLIKSVTKEKNKSESMLENISNILYLFYLKTAKEISLCRGIIKIDEQLFFNILVLLSIIVDHTALHCIIINSKINYLIK